MLERGDNKEVSYINESSELRLYYSWPFLPPDSQTAVSSDWRSGRIQQSHSRITVWSRQSRDSATKSMGLLNLLIYEQIVKHNSLILFEGPLLQLIYLFLTIQVATIQGLSGTGSLRLAAALIERYFPGAQVVISSPTWGAYCFSLKIFRLFFSWE